MVETHTASSVKLYEAKIVEYNNKIKAVLNKNKESIEFISKAAEVNLFFKSKFYI